MSAKQREWLLWENVKNNILQLNTYKHNNISNPTSGRNTKFRHSFFEKVGLWLFLSATQKEKKHANTSFQRRLWQSLTLQALRAISMKFLLIISMPQKTEWSWELGTWSGKKSVTDISKNPPHYFCWKSIGTVNENPNFDITV